MKVFIYGSTEFPVIHLCKELIKTTEGVEHVERLEGSDVAIAPLLRDFIPPNMLELPRLGTLVFHPSLLPIHRGRDSIKWSFFNFEKYTGATWFWADKGLDTGAICENEALLIQDGETMKSFYNRAVIPSAVRMLGFILADLKAGHVRKRPQIEEHATYEPPYSKIKPYVRG